MEITWFCLQKNSTGFTRGNLIPGIMTQTSRYAVLTCNVYTLQVSKTLEPSQLSIIRTSRPGNPDRTLT